MGTSCRVLVKGNVTDGWKEDQIPPGEERRGEEEHSKYKQQEEVCLPNIDSKPLGVHIPSAYYPQLEDN